jgi:hypothetical protein
MELDWWKKFKKERKRKMLANENRLMKEISKRKKGKDLKNVDSS